MARKNLVGLEIDRIKIQVRKLGFFGRIRGLMFRRRENAEALLFDFAKYVRIPIHSWFVFFPFYAVWIDGKSKIIEIRRVKPWKSLVRPEQKYVRLIEIPINNKYRGEISSLSSRIRKV